MHAGIRLLIHDMPYLFPHLNSSRTHTYRLVSVCVFWGLSAHILKPSYFGAEIPFEWLLQTKINKYTNAYKYKRINTPLCWYYNVCITCNQMQITTHGQTDWQIVDCFAIFMLLLLLLFSAVLLLLLLLLLSQLFSATYLCATHTSNAPPIHVHSGVCVCV